MYMLNKEAIKTVADVADVLEMLGVMLMDDHPLVQRNLHLLMPYVGDTNETK